MWTQTKSAPAKRKNNDEIYFNFSRGFIVENIEMEFFARAFTSFGIISYLPVNIAASLGVQKAPLVSCTRSPLLLAEDEIAPLPNKNMLGDCELPKRMIKEMLLNWIGGGM